MLKPAGWLDMPKVRPAEGLMPGLLKLKPELLSQPKSWLLLLGQGGCHGNCCSVGHIGEQGGPSRDSGHTLPLPPQKRPWSIR